MVGTDLHVCPKVSFGTIRTATRHQIMVTINKMDEWVNCADAMRWGRQIKLPIELLSQSATLFCPYRYHRFGGARGYFRVMVILFQQSYITALRLQTYALQNA